MSGPNTINPYGTQPKDVEIVSATDTVLYDAPRTGHNWYPQTLDLNIMIMGANSSIKFQDDNSNVFYLTKDVTGNQHKAWDAFAKKMVGKIHAITEGPGPFDIFIDIACSEVPTTVTP